MKTLFSAWFTPPRIGSDEQTNHRAILLSSIIHIFTGFLLLILIGGLLGGKTPSLVFILDFLCLASTMIANVLLHRKHVTLASGWLLATSFVLSTGVIVIHGSILSPITSMYILIVIIAGLMFGRRGIWLTTLVSSVILLGVEWAQTTGRLHLNADMLTLSQWFYYSALIGMTGILTLYAHQLKEKALLRARQESAEVLLVGEELRRLKNVVEWQRDLAQELAGVIEMPTALDLCLRRILSISRLDSAAVYLLNQNTGAFELAAALAAQAESPCTAAQVAIERDIWQRVSLGKPVYSTEVPLQALAGTGLCTCGFIPLSSHGSVIACLIITVPNQGAVETYDREMIEEVATHLGNTLARIQTREELTSNHARLRLSEEQFRAVFERSMLGMAMVGLDGRFFQVNRAFGQMLGYESGELMNKSVADITLAEDLAPTKQIVYQITHGLIETAQVEKRYLQRSGKPIWANTTANLIRDDNHQPMHMVVIIEDITPRKKAEALQQAIYRISETAAAANHLDDLYPALHQIISNLLPAHHCDFALLDPASGTVSFPYHSGKTTNSINTHQGERGLTEHVIRSGSAQRIDKKRCQQDEQGGAVLPASGAVDVNWLGVPLLGSAEGVLGVLAVGTDSDDEIFSEQDLQILNFVSSQAGLVIERKMAEEARHVALEKYRVLFEAFPLGITTSDAQGNIIETNQASESILGLTRSEHEQRTLRGAEWHLIRPDGSEMPPDEFPSVIALREQRRLDPVEMGIVKADGSVSWIDVTAAPIPIPDYGVVVTYSDITARRLAETALERQRQIFQKIIDKTSTFLVYLDPDFNFIEVNSGYAQTCQRQPQELIGKNHFFFYPDAENEQIFKQVRDTRVPMSIHDKPFVFPDQPERGITYWDWRLTPDVDTAGKLLGFVFSLTETTERRKMEEAMRQANQQLSEQLSLVTELKDRLREQSVRDNLTELYNRRYLYERLPGELTRALREGIKIAILMIDIDHFKHVNDTYGHAVGDLVLKAIGRMLKEHKRESDIAFRYGGEEFLLVLFGASFEASLKHAEHIRAACEMLRIDVGDQKVMVTLSAGVAVYPEHGSTMDVILSRADQALYLSKRNGRNRVTGWEQVPS